MPKIINVLEEQRDGLRTTSPETLAAMDSIRAKLVSYRKNLLAAAEKAGLGHTMPTQTALATVDAISLLLLDEDISDGE